MGKRSRVLAFLVSFGTLGLGLSAVGTLSANALSNCVVSNVQNSNGKVTFEIRYPDNTAGCDWIVPAGVTSIESAVVGGGGAGGWGNQGGGGGGGEVLHNQNFTVTPGSVIPISIGTGGLVPTTVNRPGGNGNSTSFGDIIATGGGGGGGSGPFWLTANMSAVGGPGGSSGGNNIFGTAAAMTSAGRSTYGAVNKSSYSGWTSYANRGGAGISNTVAYGSQVSYGAGAGGGGAYEAGTDSTAVSNGSGGMLTTLGRSGAGIYLMGKCLAGGGEGIYRVAAGTNTTASSTNFSTANPCKTPSGVIVEGTRSGAFHVASGSMTPAANSGGGASAGTTTAPNDGQPGANGVVLVSYTVPVPAITSSNFTNVLRPIISGTGANGATITISIGGATYTTTVAGGMWAVNLNTATPASGSLSLTANQSYSVTASATDAAGGISQDVTSTLTIDTIAPTAPVLPTTPSLTNQNNRDIAFTIEAGSSAQCSINSVSNYVPCSSPFTTGVLADGSNTLRVKATDVAGNTSSISSYTWTIDTVAPAAPVISTTAVYQTSTSVTVNYTATAGTTVTCKLDAALATSCTTSTTMSLTGLSQGSHVFTVYSADSAGNTSSATYSFTVDSIAPATPVIANTAAYSRNTSLSIAFSSEAGSTTECSLDAGPFAICTSPFGTGTLSDGNHGIRVKSIDVAGNVSSIATYNWTQDTVAPAVPVVSTSAVYQTSTSFTVNYTADAGTTVTCKLDDALATSCTSSTTMALSGLSQGSHVFTVYSVDLAGNSSSSSYNFTVDSIVPATPVIANTASYSRNSSLSIAFSSEAGSSTECSLDSGSFAVCTSPFGTGTLSDGGHALRVKSIDIAGNVSSIATYNWTQDTVAPLAPAISNTETYVTNDFVTVSFSADSGTTTCQLDSGAITACTSASTASYFLLTEGSHTLRITTADLAGNSSFSSYAFTVDTIAPSVPVIAASPEYTNSASRTFSFTFEAGSTSSCSLDSAAFVVCSSPFSTGVLTDGVHTLSIRSVDVAGNIGETATRSWTIDTIAPATPVISTTGNYKTSNSVTLNFTADSNDIVTCKLDTAVATNCAGETSKTYNNLVEGSHTFVVSVVDQAGNLSTASYSFTVDTVAPNSPVKINDNSAPRARTSQTSAIFKFTAFDATRTECRLDTIQPNAFDWTTCSSGYELTNLQPADYRFLVRSVDAAGNTSSVIQYDWEVVTGGPGLPSLAFENNVVTLSGAAGGANGDRYEMKLVDADGNIVVPWGNAQSSFALRQSNGVYRIFARLVNDQNLIGESVSQEITITGQPAPGVGVPTRLRIDSILGYSRDSQLEVSIDWPVGTKNVRLFSTQNNNAGQGQVTSLNSDWVASGESRTYTWNFTPAGAPTVTATHSLSAEFLDAKNNVINSQTATVIIDPQAPTLNNVTPVAISGNTLPIQVLGTDENGGSGISEIVVSRSSIGPASSSATFELYSITNGSATIQNVLLGEKLSVRIRDRVGNISSASFEVSALNRQTLNPVAKITGKVKVGQTLKLLPGTWPATHKLTYSWLADGMPIAGATKNTFKLTNAQAGKRITAAVTGTRATYYPIAVSTPLTATVTGGTLTAGKVKITGTAKVGQILTADPGVWKDSPTLTYTWKLGAKVVGKTPTYTLTPSVKGKTLTLTVTGSKLGFTSLAKSITSAVVKP